MKLRVLFLDDEPLVLQGLQRMLRSMRGEWEMVFVESGAKGLEAMAAGEFDAVVSDMLMPGMNGAEFLTQVRRQYPKTIRFILSGHADRTMVLECTGCAHQFLAKPCNPETLKTLVTRAALLARSIHNEEVLAKLSTVDFLPAQPALLERLVAELNAPEPSLPAAAAIIAQDTGLTALVLKLTNSAFFGSARRLANPADAALSLGLEVLKALTLPVDGRSRMQPVDVDHFSVDALWRHSYETGLCAKLIAEAENADPKIVDEAFAAGLLHDVGKFVLASSFNERYAQALELARAKGLALSSAEVELFGFSHAEVGGALFALWGLPDGVVDAITWHNNPFGSQDQAFTALTAVHAANTLTQEDHNENTPPPSPIDLPYLTRLGLVERVEGWRNLLRQHATPSTPL